MNAVSNHSKIKYLIHTQPPFFYLNTGIHIVLDGQLYYNNSVVFIEDIGGVTNNTTIQNGTHENKELICTTDKTPCCATQANITGYWFFPNETIVSSNSSNHVFTSRGDDQTVKLNYRGGEFIPGIYRCQVPDEQNVMQNVYVGIYSNTSTNEGTCDCISILCDKAHPHDHNVQCVCDSMHSHVKQSFMLVK